MTRSLIFLLAAALALPVLAQDAGNGDAAARAAALKAAVAPGKQIFIARQLQLSNEEDAAFWPTYDTHQAGLADLAERRSRLLARHEERRAAGEVDDGDIEDLAEEMLALEADEADLLESSFARLGRAGLPVQKAVRYIQLEKDLRALRHLERGEDADYRFN
ncbi:hypothetical protein [Arenimonas sp.]|uniref:hypothetical protein n=1 Tax=Arenimonas sp. TaxID=1872635 RepID=UPI0035AF9190